MTSIISPTLKNQIERILKEFISQSTPDPLGLRRMAVEIQALPLCFDAGGVFALRPTGEVIAFQWDDLASVRDENDPRIRNMVLFQGSRKYPELEVLVPSKPSDATVCPHCGGTGILTESEKLKIDNLVCYCGGLGWLP